MGKILTNVSNFVEYKRELPEASERWLKTIVSFSNTAKGSLVIGIEDETKEIVGIKESRSFLEGKIMDTIYNGISPVPMVDTRVMNYEGKDVFIVEVSKGWNRHII